MMKLLPLASLALLIPMATHAQTPRERRDIPWYMANERAMRETLQRCARDARAQDTYNCRNAEAAATQLRADRNAREGLRSLELQERDLDPVRNQVTFRAFTRACERRARGEPTQWMDQEFIRFCDRVDWRQPTGALAPGAGSRNNGK
jgi:hypothetical protein